MGARIPVKVLPYRLSKGSRFTTSVSYQNKSSHPMATPQNASTLAPGTALWLQFVVLFRTVHNTMNFQAQKFALLALFGLLAAPLIAQNRALDFDGFFSHVVVPHDAMLDLSGAYTIEVRFQQGFGDSDYRTLIDHRNTDTNESNYTLQVYDGTECTVFMNNGTNLGFLFNENMQVGWNMFSIVMDGTSLTSYLNGATETQALTGDPSAALSSDIYIGASANGEELFDGLIDEIRIWDHARCEELIAAYANTELAGTEPGLVAWWNFNQGTADYQNPNETTLSDRSGNNLNGTLNTFVLNGDVSNWRQGDTGLDADPDLSCDDGDGATINDQYDSDCNCAGQKRGCTNIGACNYDADAIVNDGSCTYPGCSDIAACNFDPTAGCTDNTRCSYAGVCATNDNPANAETPTQAELGTCNFAAGRMEGTGNSGSTATVDVWYEIAPVSKGLRIETRTTEFDIALELYDADFNLVGSSDKIAGVGSEILNIGDLEIGDTYYLALGGNGALGAATFDICVQYIPGSECDSGYGPHEFTGTFKADFVGADKYNFIFTSNSSGDVYSTGMQTGTIAQIRNVSGMQPGFEYTVEIQAQYELGDGDGGTDVITVGAAAACTMMVEAPDPSTMRAADNCANHGAHYFGDYIRTDSYRPAVEDWMWKFTRIDQPELPITYTRGSSNRLLRLSTVEGLEQGAQYHVKVRPIYDVFYMDFGDKECLELVVTAPSAQEFWEDELDAENILDRNGFELPGDRMKIELFPNPNTDGRLYLTATDVKGQKADITIRTLTGERVKQLRVNPDAGQLNVALNIDGLAPGVYLVDVRDQTQRATEKLVVR